MIMPSASALKPRVVPDLAWIALKSMAYHSGHICEGNRIGHEKLIIVRTNIGAPTGSGTGPVKVSSIRLTATLIPRGRVAGICTERAQPAGEL